MNKKTNTVIILNQPIPAFSVSMPSLNKIIHAVENGRVTVFIEGIEIEILSIETADNISVITLQPKKIKQTEEAIYRLGR